MGHSGHFSDVRDLSALPPIADVICGIANRRGVSAADPRAERRGREDQGTLEKVGAKVELRCS